LRARQRLGFCRTGPDGRTVELNQLATSLATN
jgi:hypothetical protein